MSEWRVEYKCRRCGEIERSAGGNEEICRNAVMYASIDEDMLRKLPGVPIRLHGLHHKCEDGGMGLSDLIGAAPA